MRTLFSLLAALLLSGCFWEGPAFYQPDPAQAGPLPPGLYKLDAEDKQAPQRLKVVRTGDGALLIAAPEDFKDGKPSRVVLMPLAAPGRHLWVVQTQIGETADPVAYGLLERDGDVRILDPALDCQGNEALVRAAGGTIEGEGGSSSCLFADGAALERALIAYAGAHPGFEKPARLTRIGGLKRRALITCVRVRAACFYPSGPSCDGRGNDPQRITGVPQLGPSLRRGSKEIGLALFAAVLP